MLSLSDLDREMREAAIARLNARVLGASAIPIASSRDYTNNRVAWVRDCIQWNTGEGPTSYQLEALEQFDKGIRRVTLRGPHMLGKTSLASWLTLHFALTCEAKGWDWKVPTTASAWRQLSHYLWPEIHKWAKRLRWDLIGRKPFDTRAELLQLMLKLPHGEAFAVASDKAETIEGAHADHLFYIFDEAKVIPTAIWDAAEGALAGIDCYALAISTPGEPQGRFYEIHARKPGYQDWWVRHITKEEVIAERPKSGFEKWARDRAAQWGEESAVYQNRVEGEFASSEADGIIPLAWIGEANERWWEMNESDEWGSFTCVGVDVGRGGDQTVLAIRHGAAIKEIQRYGIADTMVVAGYVTPILRANSGYAVIDSVGIGAGVVDRIREQKIENEQVGKPINLQVVAFNGGESTNWKDRSGEMLFLNKRAAAWWNLRELLDPANGHNLALPPDDLLTGDLVAPHWRPTSGGRILVESKEDIRKRIGRSTDSGDAVVQAFWNEPPVEHPPFRIGRVSVDMPERVIRDTRRMVVIK